MQQRRLRPGDVVDDYCPRDRRITDHAIVAMIDDKIKQTRCVSCDTEHEYKHARVPPQRRKRASAGLFNQVLDGLQPPARLAQPIADTIDEPESPPEPASLSVQDEPEPSWPVAAPAEDSPSLPQAAQPSGDEPEDGPVRRPLIRAQLPRHEGQPPPTRTLPDFTVRQSKNGRGNRPIGGQRHGGGRRRAGEVQGSGGPPRFGGSRQPGHGRQGGDRSQNASGWGGNRAERGRGGRGRGGKKR
jgi:hypothetical protein